MLSRLTLFFSSRGKVPTAFSHGIVSLVLPPLRNILVWRCQFWRHPPLETISAKMKIFFIINKFSAKKISILPQRSFFCPTPVIQGGRKSGLTGLPPTDFIPLVRALNVIFQIINNLFSRLWITVDNPLSPVDNYVHTPLFNHFRQVIHNCCG